MNTAIISLDGSKRTEIIKSFVADVVKSDRKSIDTPRRFKTDKLVAKRIAPKQLRYKTTASLISLDIKETKRLQTIINNAKFNGLVENIIKKSDPIAYEVRTFIKRCRIISYFLLFCSFLCIFGGFLRIFLHQKVDAYFICFVIISFCCLSLFVTLRLIIREWKKNKNVQQKNIAI